MNKAATKSAAGSYAEITSYARTHIGIRFGALITVFRYIEAGDSIPQRFRPSLQTTHVSTPKKNPLPPT
ncbi:MAG: hypothetical protein ACU837_05285 [Gammaproteobacteria bacterium]